MITKSNEDIYFLLVEMSNTMQTNYSRLDSKIEKLDNKIDNVEKKLNERIDKLDAKIDNVEKKLSERIDQLDIKIDTVKKELNDKIETTKKEITEEFDKRLKEEATYINESVNEKIDGVYILCKKDVESNTKRIIELEKYAYKNRKLKV